jgi:hypothetical protein
MAALQPHLEEEEGKDTDEDMRWGSRLSLCHLLDRSKEKRERRRMRMRKEE